MIRIGKTWGIGVLCWCLSQTAWAGVLTGELDKTEGTLDDQFIYTLSIQGSFDGEPALPAIDGLEIRQGGKSQNISIINGNYSKEVQVQFVLTPTREGQFTIPAIKLKVDKENLETLPLEIKVAKGLAPTRSDGLFIERTFSKTKAYVGEAVAVHTRFYHRLKLAGAQPEIKYPASFQVKNQDEQKNFTQMVEGQEYSVSELSSFLLAGREGQYQIEPVLLLARVAVQRRRGRGMLDQLLGPTEFEERRFRSDPAQLEILPLPLEGRRKDFSGLVGDFTLDAQTSPRELDVGETVNIALTVSGNGSVSGMSEPELKLGTFAKVYKDKAEIKEALDDEGLHASKTFKFALVPTQPGQHNLGSITLQIFDPTLGQYRDLKVDLGEIQVKGEAMASTPSAPAAAAQDTAQAPKSQAREVTVMNKDLVEPYLASKLYGTHVLSRNEMWMGGVLSGAGFLALGGLFWRTQQLRPQGQKRSQAARARKLAGKRLTEAKDRIARAEIAQAAQTVQLAFREYFAAKFERSGASLTLGDMEAQIRSLGGEPSLQQELRSVWSSLDQLIYAPPLGKSPALGEELLSRSAQILDTLEKKC